MQRRLVLAVTVLACGSPRQVMNEWTDDPEPLAETFAAVTIGSLTFTGSVTAFLKLRGTLSGKPLLFPGRHAASAMLGAGCVGLAVPVIVPGGIAELQVLLGAAALAGVLGIHLVMGIGGADMPVVVSLLNSYSGWTASAAGFMLSNDLLIITGALVGSSGAILSYIMCRAMNRSFISVIFGGFGAEEGAKPAKGAAAPAGEVKSISAGETAALSATNVMRKLDVTGLSIEQTQTSLKAMEAPPARDPGGGSDPYNQHRAPTGDPFRRNAASGSDPYDRGNLNTVSHQRPAPRTPVPAQPVRKPGNSVLDQLTGKKK